MAKKDNENEFEDLTGGASDNINEADDSFGLPDINFEPLEQKEETEEPQTEETPEPTEEPVAESTDEATAESETDASADEDEIPWYEKILAEDDNPSESDSASETETEAEPVVESSEEPVEEPVMYAQPIEEEPAAEEASESEETTEEEPQQEAESTYVPGQYAEKYKEKNNQAIVWSVIFLVIILGVAGWWFLWEQPKRAEAEAQRIAQQEQADQAAKERQAREAEEQRLAEEEAARLAAEEAAAAEEEVIQEPGTILTISERTGRYYVVVASAIDGDLAMDYAQKLAADGRSVSIIAPYGSVKFHRVAVNNLESLGEAETVMNDLRADYADAWVIKY